MFDHALQVLEFQAVSTALAQHAETTLGTAACLETRPSYVHSEVWARQALLAEAWELAGTGLPSLKGISDLSRTLNLCSKEGVASGEELARVGSSLSVMREARFALAKASEGLCRLKDLGERLPDLPKLHAELVRCLDGSGEVLDEASTELGLVRHKKARAAQRILESIQKYVSGRTRDLLSDPVYTTRNGRYVIPLKAENKGKVRGIVHDSSASGQTVYLEPEDVVQLGNQLREAEAHERAEVERILRLLSSSVGREADVINEGVSAASELDAAFAKVRYGHGMRACLPTELQGAELQLTKAKHPLLDTRVVVPFSLALGGSTESLLITGPNTGGKTVAIKAVGLCALMAQAGMMVPAEEAKIGCFTQVWADIGDEQSLEQSLSTFSGHIKNIAESLKSCKRGALVLLDEVGAGTDPAEGASLARAILLEFKSSGCVTMASTHYGELKVMASTEPGFVNASMEFDLKSLRPTYNLLVGTPGSSHALKVAERYGLPAGVVQKASEGLTVGEHDIALMIERLATSQKQAVKAQSEADRLAARLRHVEAETAKRLKEAEETRQRVRTRAAEELDDVLRLIRIEASDVFESLKRDSSQAGLEKARARLKDIQTAGQAFSKDMRPSESKPSKVVDLPTIEKGMSVAIAGFDQRGTVLEVAKGKNALVQVGALRMSVPSHRLTPVEQAKAVDRKSVTGIGLAKSHSVKAELSIRQMRAEEAEEELDRYLDDVVLAGFSKVRIVHGKGEGVLRSVTHRKLSAHPHVKRFRDAAEDEGSHGVTIVELD